MVEHEYPVERCEYSKIIGGLRVHNIAGILKDDFDFKVNTGAVEANKVDLVAWFKEASWGDVYLRAEMINWKYDYELTDTIRKDSMIRNLTRHDSKRKWLITSFRRNLGEFIPEFEAHGIEIKEIGFQTQPTDYEGINFYEFFRKRNEADDKKPWNEETKRILELKIESWLNE